MKRIVTIGGGTGQYTLLTGLKTIPDLDISAVVTMADSGGSSGILRTERGVLPPGDVLRCLLALATADEDVVALFAHRLSEGGGVGGHTIGNIALTGAAEQRGDDFLAGIETMAKILKPRGRVLPVTTDRAELCALLSDGSSVRGEHLIDRPRHDPALRIESVWLEPKAKTLPAVVEAIVSADAIVVGPGDLFTSVIPNVLVDGITQAFEQSRGQIIFVVNVMTKRGETDGFSVEEFVFKFEAYQRHAVDTVLINTRPPSDDLRTKYQTEGAQWIGPRVSAGCQEAAGELITHDRWGRRNVVLFPLLSDGSFARHDPLKLAHVIRALI